MLIPALLGLTSATKLRFGGNQCEYGPSFWCENLKQAKECSATPYCVEKEWNKPTKPDNICETCKTAVGLVHMYLTDNRTRDEVEEILDYACEVVPEGKMQDDCFTLIKDESDIIFDFIEHVTDPGTICNAIQLCSAATEEEILAAIKAKVSQLPAATVEIVDPTESENDTPAEEPVLSPIPIDIGRVGKGMLGTGMSQVSDFKNTGCDICRLMVGKIDEALEDKKTQGEVMDYAEEACDVLPSEYSDQCKAAIEMYGPQIIKMLEAQLDPSTVCSTLGLCAKLSTWKLPLQCAQPKKVGMCRALVPSYFFNPTTNKCEYFGYGGCQGNQNRFSSVDECDSTCVRAFGLNKCDDCKLAVIYIKSYLDDPDNEKSLIEALDEVCQNVPSSFAMECQDMVDTYGTELLKYAETLLDPNFVCEKLELCGERPIESKKQMIVGANSCTFGPSHWCANHENAKSCKATDYCVQNGLLEPEK